MREDVPSVPWEEYYRCQRFQPGKTDAYTSMCLMEHQRAACLITFCAALFSALYRVIHTVVSYPLKRYWRRVTERASDVTSRIPENEQAAEIAVTTSLCV